MTQAPVLKACLKKLKAAETALEEIRRLIWTPRMTMAQLRHKAALILKALDEK